MVLLHGLSQGRPPPSIACCPLRVRKVREQQPFSMSGSPRAHQPLRSGLGRRCILWVLKAGQKNLLRWSGQTSDMALGWLLSFPASWHPWAAIPKPIVSTTDDIAWAGGADCSKWCWHWGGESYSPPTLPSHPLLQKAPWQSACPTGYNYVLSKEDRGGSLALSPDQPALLQPDHFWLCPGPSPPAVCKTEFGHACWDGSLQDFSLMSLLDRFD